MDTILWALMGIVAGACIATQAPINAQLGRNLGVPIADAAEALRLPIGPEALRAEAVEWSVTRGARSGRVAGQAARGRDRADDHGRRRADAAGRGGPVSPVSKGSTAPSRHLRKRLKADITKRRGHRGVALVTAMLISALAAVVRLARSGSGSSACSCRKLVLCASRSAVLR